jgi:hypothetical protein
MVQPGVVLGQWWHHLDDGRIQCDLCPRECKLHEGQRGFCFRGLATPTEVLSSRPLTKLLSKPAETALVNHFVKWHLLRKQGRRLNTQVKPLDVDFAVRAIARNDQKAEPVDMALKISIGLFAGLCKFHLTQNRPF